MATSASSIKAPADSEFVLDDGLDEEADDDVLAFQSERIKQEEAEELEKAAALTPQRPTREKPVPRAQTSVDTSASENAADSSSTPLPPVSPTSTNASDTQSAPLTTLAVLPFVDLEVTGLPVGSNRTHLEALLGTGALRSIRLGAMLGDTFGPSTLVVSREAAERVLSLREPVIRGKPVVITEVSAVQKVANVFADLTKRLPMNEISDAAERARASLELGAKDAQRRFEEMNEKYELSTKATAAAAAAASAAKQFDVAVGATKNATAVAEAASVAAKEVDENWRVTERAREVLNSALADERAAPAARMLLEAFEKEDDKPRRKEYTPTADRRNPDVVADSNEGSNPSPAQKLEF